MKTIRVSRFLSGACFSLAVYILGSTSGFGQATRTWVSGVGDDANPCSRTAPCKTFAGSISKTAAGGEINVLDPGGFGGLTVTKAITVDGSKGSIAGVLVSGTNAIIINAGVNDVVTLRNLQINGLGTGINGIRIIGARAVHIENCDIFNFANNGILVDPSAGNTSLQVFIKNTIIRNINPNGAVAGGQGGITVRPAAGFNAVVSVENTSMEQCNFGIRVEDRGTLTAKNCFSGNHFNHGYIAVANAVACTLNLDNCVAANNDNNAASSGVQSFGANATVRLGNTSVFGNRTGLVAAGGAVISLGNNRVTGNTTNTSGGAPTSTVPPL